MKKNVSNIVLYACLFEITCITPSGKGHDPLDDKKKYEYIIHYVYIKIKTIKKAHTFTFKHHMHIYMNGHSKKFNH